MGLDVKFGGFLSHYQQQRMTYNLSDHVGVYVASSVSID